MRKVLISTAWSPTHSPYFSEYADGISNLNLDGLEHELFITTHFAKSKFQSIVGAMHKAERYAKLKGFTHIFNVEADRKLIDVDLLHKMLDIDSDIVLGYSHREHPEIPEFVQYTPSHDCVGWGTMLVTTQLLKEISFTVGDRGAASWPDRMWLKRCYVEGKKITIMDIDVITMEKSSNAILDSFAPELA